MEKDAHDFGVLIVTTMVFDGVLREVKPTLEGD